MALFGLSKSKVATFGLDIGSSAVKLVELVPGKTGYALKSFAMVDLPREAITEGSFRQPAVVTDAIRGVAPASTAQTLDELSAVGVEFTTTDEILKAVGNAAKETPSVNE